MVPLRSGRLSRKSYGSYSGIDSDAAEGAKPRRELAHRSASRLEPAEKVFAEFEQGLLAIASDV